MALFFSKESYEKQQSLFSTLPNSAHKHKHSRAVPLSPPHAQRHTQISRDTAAPRPRDYFRTPATTGQSLSFSQLENNSREYLLGLGCTLQGAYLSNTFALSPPLSFVITNFAGLGDLDSAFREQQHRRDRWLSLSITHSCRGGMTPCAPRTGETHAAKPSLDTSISIVP
jgi:hypothetical protein